MGKLGMRSRHGHAYILIVFNIHVSSHALLEREVDFMKKNTLQTFIYSRNLNKSHSSLLIPNSFLLLKQIGNSSYRYYRLGI